MTDNSNQYKTIAIITALVVVFFVFGKRLLAIVDKILIATGLQDSAVEQVISNAAGTASNVESPFSPNYQVNLRKKGSVYLLYKNTAVSIAKQIYDSVGTIYDTPEQGLAAFKQLRYKSQVSQVADEFQINYKADLFSWLQSRYDRDSQKEILGQILKYVDSLPSGLVPKK
jgi:hypothetical protein